MREYTAEELKEILERVAEYVFYGNGQQQGTALRPDPNLPSVESPRGEAIRLLRPFLKK